MSRHPGGPVVLCVLLSWLLLGGSMAAEEVLPDTERLDWDGDLAAKMVDGIDRFLLAKLAQAPAAREALHGPAGIVASVAERRARLAHMLGVRDSRIPIHGLELVSRTDVDAELAATSQLRIRRVRWSALPNLHSEGLLIEPQGPIKANVVALPDAEQTPEWLAGQSYVRQLAASGCRVVVPAVVSRQVERRRNSELTDREFIHRSAFELGRLLTGYELQAIFGVIDWFRQQGELPIGIVGWGEGGRLALYAAALEPAVTAVCVSGYFGPREGSWQEPLDRNVFGLLQQFGDAEIAALIAAPRIVIDATPGPSANVKTKGGAPYELRPHTAEQVRAEVARARRLGVEAILMEGPPVEEPAEETVSRAALMRFCQGLGVAWGDEVAVLTLPPDEGRQQRLLVELDHFNQRLLAESPTTRKEFLKDLDVRSLRQHEDSVAWYRDYFRDQVVGTFDDPLLPPQVRTRRVFDEPRWTGYEVVLDVFPDVFAFGILLMPKDLQAGERRPVVVCQHGLEGRPRHVIEKDHPAYHDFAAKLAERGFITFAPQNIYIFRDRFRTLQRKANPLGKTLFSIMVPQHQQIVDWLAGLPQVDPERIAFYGLSYGGKSAMRIPPLVDRYCLAICSADFNDWVWKNASTISPYSYVWSGEYEIFEWDLGSTFNYAEMAALIAPRPFMVERGHFDGVAPDERVAYEFAKVRHLYQAQLGIGDRCEIEFFVGPHTIHGVGTYAFLHRHLNWPRP